MKNLIRLIRPKQWIKNLIVLLPVFFGGALLHPSAIYAGLITALSFSFAASSIYCLNDIIDIEDDKHHPIKCNRPLASGAISIPQGYTLMVLMLILSMASTFLLYDHQLETAGVIAFYWLLNIGYCLKLKQYAIIDVCIVAFGFVLRVLAGGVSTSIHLSKWIVLMTFLLMLFLSFAKRRDDVVRMNETGHAPRQNTIRYNLTFINQAITITSSVTLVCYIMYTVSPETIQNFHTDYLYLTSVFVLVGLLRYIQIAVVDKKSGDPTKVILRDRFTQLIVLAFGLAFLFIIYVLR
ncbi:decaprenyl-phosphate phosphoribosyltransferase [Prevotella histicola]|jgi:prenyltransferase, ubiA family|uniref:decaprenyl-phosphate phosphoribosyltransferase n=1 Tax=Prevotella histicola TaxID=470565 RepID=UPI001CB29CC0|nr:decaprenyl-phosphate phosphoribosyltransferase [Prevotella histicola]MBF1410231.1 decaprenyl-phosphate phosphoribosyltransferase [Prevotella histicola]MBF1417458.1 decaprenyl-phosphate phosphoribosyltransferase [Prevotella histicola]MBS6662712.1 decaprenyl-phosphate phosphoribosyltransferase [Prevotella histicola]